MKKVLFVCLGNICRSPAAEGVMWHLLSDSSLNGLVEVDSAGTSSVHAGERADARMRRHAEHRGIELKSISRGVDQRTDFDYFDYIIAMDSSNFRNLSALCNDGNKHKIKMMSDFCSVSTKKDVPDPYYGGEQGFEIVLDMVTDGCQGLLSHLAKEVEA
jgi:protein-tyrosine phosphatase